MWVAPVEQKPRVLTIWKQGLFLGFINDGSVCHPEVFFLCITLAQQYVKGLSNLWATCAVATANNILECAILSKLHKLIWESSRLTEERLSYFVWQVGK